MRKANPTPWLILIHQIPAKPAYLRVKIGRRLRQIGAVPIKASVYTLPNRSSAAERFHWIAEEIRDGGGTALICEAQFLHGISRRDVEALFQEARDADYEEIVEKAREILSRVRSDSASGNQRDEPEKERVWRAAGADLSRLQRRLDEVGGIDFFAAPSRDAALEALASLQAALEGERRDRNHPEKEVLSKADLRGRTWVTRSGIEEDRIACAWLVRRFIDPEAHFRFVEPNDYEPAADEIRFDMFEAEFTHEGDRCTFEVLLDRLELQEAALRRVAEVIHDIDQRDDKFRRAETPGIKRLIEGIVRRNHADDDRLKEGMVIFDVLHASFSSPKE